ncbi:LysR family transcriptional regulator [Flexivirga endophytica]|uniref:LysR family transcriptional regulator n=1 Tax=Flexivirga endophytica TaxID=1849103 RepID=A0A916T3X3_9MICO|nr:LysR family transcriptional regulator [Flexivirga endophytica]GGB29480.1 LysR family transcriptional regulator [Flexivirga endophytica]GHB50562.1 LysR family transcriptional regulator [Flexivirga endophytica]
MLDIHRLRVFRSVVASGSVQAAATHLGYTPSAVSQHINQLQRETGLTLFEKAGRGISPTPTGRLLAQQSEDAMGALARLDNVVTDLRHGRTGSLSIACFASAGEEWVPQLVAKLQREFKDVLITVDLNEHNEAARPDCDLDIRTEDLTETPVVPKGYTRHELITEPYVAVLPAKHPLVDKDEVSMSDLADEPWIDDSNEDQTCGRILRRAINKSGLAPRMVAECQDHHTSFALVAAGIGVTLAPRLTLGSLPRRARAVPLTDPLVQRGISVHVRDAAAGNPVTRRALELLHEIASDDER